MSPISSNASSGGAVTSIANDIRYRLALVSRSTPASWHGGSRRAPSDLGAERPPSCDQEDDAHEAEQHRDGQGEPEPEHGFNRRQGEREDSAYLRSVPNEPRRPARRERYGEEREPGAR
jgi:hypothetical protein